MQLFVSFQCIYRVISENRTDGCWFKSSHKNMEVEPPTSSQGEIIWCQVEVFHPQLIVELWKQMPRWIFPLLNPIHNNYEVVIADIDPIDANCWHENLAKESQTCIEFMLHRSPVQLIWSRKWRVNTKTLPIMYRIVSPLLQLVSYTIFRAVAVAKRSRECMCVCVCERARTQFQTLKLVFYGGIVHWM